MTRIDAVTNPAYRNSKHVDRFIVFVSNPHRLQSYSKVLDGSGVMYAIEALDFDEIDLVSGGNMGFFETIGWAYDNPGTALGQAADKFAGWYRVNSSEDPNYFIG